LDAVGGRSDWVVLSLQGDRSVAIFGAIPGCALLLDDVITTRSGSSICKEMFIRAWLEAISLASKRRRVGAAGSCFVRG
jgi:hypothetical protein